MVFFYLRVYVYFVCCIVWLLFLFVCFLLFYFTDFVSFLFIPFDNIYLVQYKCWWQLLMHSIKLGVGVRTIEPNQINIRYDLYNNVQLFMNFLCANIAVDSYGFDATVGVRFANCTWILDSFFHFFFFLNESNVSFICLKSKHESTSKVECVFSNDNGCVYVSMRVIQR